ncbi:MAG: hypothetical protein ITG07_02725 [Candidimonas sp.]|nr:hypothetical protein [Candidimonas sp.]
MFVIVAFAVGLLVYIAISMAIAPIQDTFVRQRAEIIRDDVKAVISAISDQHSGGSAPYLTPSQIVASQGYEHLRTRGWERLQFTGVSGIGTGVSGIGNEIWRFNRAAIWFESPYHYVGNEAYLSAANNACGNGQFSASESWCGREQSIWGKIESKGGYSALVFAEKQRLSRTMSKFYKRYNKDRTFSSIPNGSSSTLAALVGYTGTASACAHIFSYNEIPFDCHDLFNYWGVPVVFHKFTDLHVALANRTEIFDGSGNPVRLLEEARLE